MRVDARLIGTILSIALLGAILGCSKGGGDGGTNPPQSHAPTIAIQSGPADTIAVTDTAVFVWHGADQDGNLAGYYAGLDGNYSWTLDTTATYTNFTAGTSYTFRVFAKDSNNAFSDTASWAFVIRQLVTNVTLHALGIGITDADGDGFWTQFNVKWSPVINTPNAEDLRLFVGVKPTYGSWPEWTDSTTLINRNPGQVDSLTYSLPLFAKSYYNIRLEVHDAEGVVLAEIPYSPQGSLAKVGLEDIDGFFAWFDDAWTANGIDSLPQGNPDGYYESIELWWNVDAYPDAGRVKVVVYERNSANEERYLTQSFLYDVDGFGNSDAMGTLIHAGITFDHYDYRLELLDQDNNFLGELDYGADPDLMEIPLGSPVSLTSKPEAVMINR
ncbi:MAG: hypothetical protein NTW14_06760 [bacterium]|nr:hypothetical protein [bacterium]